jgi:hypothetical protein
MYFFKVALIHIYAKVKGSEADPHHFALPEAETDPEPPQNDVASQHRLKEYFHRKKEILVSKNF